MADGLNNKTNKDRKSSVKPKIQRHLQNQYIYCFPSLFHGILLPNPFEIRGHINLQVQTVD
jgi:hypothetical protein